MAIKLQNGNPELLDRQPPFDLQAEMALLGSILLSPARLDDIANIRSADFYDDANGTIYNAVREMHDAGKMVDIELLRSNLTKAGNWERIGGAAYYAKVIQSTPTAAHAVHYARNVKRLSTLRQLIYTGTEIIRDSFDTTEESDALIDRAEAKLYSIRDKWDDAAPVHVTDSIHAAMDRIEQRIDTGKIEGTIRTGFTDLDERTGGFRDSELTILAARPSMGKTALAMNLMHNVAGYGHAVAFFSLEMSSEELADRLLVSASQVNSHRIRSGTLSQDDRQQLVSVAGEVCQLLMFIDDKPSQTVNRIAGQVRRLRRKHDIQLVIIDYLQLIEPDDHRAPRQEQVSRMSRRMKMMAKEFKVPVVCLSQLNRQGEESKDHIPKLSHLRESGAIEQDADNVWFVHREEYYQRGEKAEECAGQAEIIIAKQRNGPTGSVPLVWRKEYMRFDDKAPNRLSVFDNFNTYTEQSHPDEDF